MGMLRCMCRVTRRDIKIRNEHVRGTTRLVQASKKITEKTWEKKMVAKPKVGSYTGDPR